MVPNSMVSRVWRHALRLETSLGWRPLCLLGCVELETDLSNMETMLAVVSWMAGRYCKLVSVEALVGKSLEGEWVIAEALNWIQESGRSSYGEAAVVQTLWTYLTTTPMMA